MNLQNVEITRTRSLRLSCLRASTASLLQSAADYQQDTLGLDKRRVDWSRRYVHCESTEVIASEVTVNLLYCCSIT